MRNLNHAVVFIGLAFACLFAVGCRDKCKKINCVHGTCTEGVCNCEAGYFGEDCNKVINAGFNGTYSLTEQCTAGGDSYTLKLLPVAGSLTNLSIIGIWEQMQDTIVAVGDESGLQFTIGRQSLGQNELEGEATSDADYNSIELNYSVYAPGASTPFDACVATLEKN